MKKALSVITAILLVLMIAVPAFAADPVIKGPENGHAYDVFQVFTGDVEEDELTKDKELTNVKYGKNAVLTGSKNVGDGVPSSVLKTIEDIEGTDGQKATALIQYCNLDSTVFGQINDTNKTLSVPSGYYLIRDNGKDGESTSLYMISVIDSDLTITPKTSDTTLDKVIVDSKGDTIGKGKGAEAESGDKVYFKVSVKLSERMDDFSKYKVSIIDTLSSTLTYNGDAVIKNGTTDVTASFAKDASALTWTCDDCTKIAEKGDTLVLTYSATLGDTPTIGQDGNTNSAVCDYSNNPQDLTSVGTTPKSEVKVYSINIIVNKVDDNNEALTGATFKLSKDNEEIKTIDGASPTSLSTFTFTGLTSGKYKLEETSAPKGFKKAAAVEFEVTKKIADDGSITYACTKEGVTVNSEAGTVSTTVMNRKGSSLPITGGVGTVIFTVLGTLLAFSAVSVLISKKKAE